MEIEMDCTIPFLGSLLLNEAPTIESKVFVKPTNTGLLLHHQSHVDSRYKRALVQTMVDRGFRISSSWALFIDECERLKSMFSKLKYPDRLVNNTINRYISTKTTVNLDSSTIDNPSDVIRIILPFKDQRSADTVRKRLRELSHKILTLIQPVFKSKKIKEVLGGNDEIKPNIVNQQCVVYKFKYNLCDTGSYVGYTKRHLHQRIDEHKNKSSSIAKHYLNEHLNVINDLASCFSVLKKCRSEFDCKINEMLYIRELKPSLNVQSDSYKAKVFI